MKYMILLILLSCGKSEKRCVSIEEARLRCKADVVRDYWPGTAPESLMKQCEYYYPVEACY
jgi:hypothetical protein